MAFRVKDLELNPHQPIYIQLVAYIKLQIHLGNVETGDELPSRRVLATMLDINPATVQKAYKQLEDEHLIVTLNNVKSVLSFEQRQLDEIKKELTENKVREFLDTVKQINLSFKEVIGLISELWDKP